jgi:hypothetical protein
MLSSGAKYTNFIFFGLSDGARTHDLPIPGEESNHYGTDAVKYSYNILLMEYISWFHLLLLNPCIICEITNDLHNYDFITGKKGDTGSQGNILIYPTLSMYSIEINLFC